MLKNVLALLSHSGIDKVPLGNVFKETNSSFCYLFGGKLKTIPFKVYINIPSK